MKEKLATFKALAQEFSVLYVEDDYDIRSELHTYLSKFFASVDAVSDGEEGLEYYRNGEYDIVITDINMPHMNGIDMLSEIKLINPAQETIVVSAYSDPSYFMDAILMGVSGYIVKPINFIQLNETLYRSLTRMVMARENLHYKEHLEDMVEQRSREKLKLEEEKFENFEKTLQSLVHMIEGRDTYTGGHSQRVAHYSRIIAEKMEVPKEECDLIYRAGILHDIGKIATPDTILLKPGKLTSLEYRLIQEHVQVGREMLNDIPMYHPMAEIIRYHHEHYDGQGYPEGLAGDEIPLLSHIMIIADAFDAMTTNRIYKARMDVSEALDELHRLSGSQFHPDVVVAAVDALADVTPPESVSQLPTSQIEQERFAYYYRDRVSGAFNQEYLDFILAANHFSGEYRCINVLSINRFSKYNHTFGWYSGNMLLRKFADHLAENYREDLIFRIYGDDFVVICKEETCIDPGQFGQIAWIAEADIEIVGKHFDLRETDIGSFEELEKFIFRLES